jgi:hypothetical protein
MAPVDDAATVRALWGREEAALYRRSPLLTCNWVWRCASYAATSTYGNQGLAG